MNEDIYSPQESIELKVVLNRGVVGGGVPQVNLTVGSGVQSWRGAWYKQESGRDTLAFRCRVKEGDLEATAYQSTPAMLSGPMASVVSGGAVIKAQRLCNSSNIRWRITLEPDSNGDVAVVLPETAN